MKIQPRHHDDLNLSRLNLIVALDQVDMQEWSVTYESRGRIVRISCEAGVKYAVPHGLDSDVSAALINLYIEEGMPDDGRITVAATALLHLCGWHKSGKYMGLLRDCLERLHQANYTVSGGWRDHPKQRWTHAKFHFIESLNFTTLDGVGLFDERSMIVLRLAEDVTASIRSGYLKPLDSEFMTSLSRPRTRVLYRVLDAARFDPENPDRQVDTLTFPVLAWGDQCKIPSEGQAWRVIRALTSPHQELIKRGYLADVILSGRGKDQTVRYEFARDFTKVDPALMRKFREYGVADGMVRKLVREHGESFLTETITRFAALVSSGVLVVRKTKAAALMHLIAHPDDYPYPNKPAPPPTKAAPAMQPLLAEPSLEEDFADLTPERAADRLIRRLDLHYRKLLRAPDYDQIRHRVLTGDIIPAELLRTAVSAVAAGKQEQFVANLRQATGH
ncbi:replication initiator protein A [Deinococcus xianganensis]|uniref:Replication initiator protein A n=1 Tax=Deinococcus xianganensis TaxID=1507289 RepID=A0A6I4YN00_9DEIO|nr:replication initiator protein A [Deinococcus xianganensis]MXV21184.1 Replication initiator protein A [Deinococcus xianganensis]